MNAPAIPAGVKPYLLGGLVGAVLVLGASHAPAVSLPRFCHCDHPNPPPGPGPGPGPLPPPGPLPKPDWLPDGPPAPPPFVPDPMARPAAPAPAWEWRAWPLNPKWEMHGRMVDGEFLVNEWRPVDGH